MDRRLACRLFFFLSITGGLLAAAPQRILFVGNSYTHTNNLAGMVRVLAQGNGLAPDITLMAPGGRSFEDHYLGNYSNAMGLIQDGHNGLDWDVVVLQTQSFEPVGDPANMLAHAQLLADHIRLHNPASRIVYFNTWAYRDLAALAGPAGGYPPETYPADMDEMQDRLNQGYLACAQATGGEIAPVGEAWRALRAANPSSNLFASDGTHPNRDGTFLAAVVMYQIIFAPADLESAIPPVGASLVGIPGWNNTTWLESGTPYNFAITATRRGAIMPAAFAALATLPPPDLLAQDFSAGGAPSSYVDALNPGSTKLTGITASNSGQFSITGGALRFSGVGGTERGSVVRNENFAGSPSKLVVSLDLEVTGNSAAKTSAVQLNLGDNFSNGTTAESAAKRHSTTGIDLTSTPGQFKVGSTVFTGRQTFIWVVNNSGAAYSYTAPNGTTRSLANDRSDLWIGNTLARSSLAAVTAATPLNDFKLIHDLAAAPAAVSIDNLLIYQPQ